jgi:hypothetical protein
MLRILVLIVGFMTAGLAISEASAASCTTAALQKIIRKARALENTGRSCDRAGKQMESSSNPNFAKVCSACRRAIIAYSELDQIISANKSCFTGDRAGRRLLASFRSSRESINFMRRGCGY